MTYVSLHNKNYALHVNYILNFKNEFFICTKSFIHTSYFYSIKKFKEIYITKNITLHVSIKFTWHIIVYMSDIQKVTKFSKNTFFSIL